MMFKNFKNLINDDKIYLTIEFDNRLIIFNIINIIVYFIYVIFFIYFDKYINAEINFNELTYPLLLMFILLLINNILIYKIYNKYDIETVFYKILLNLIIPTVFSLIISYLRTNQIDRYYTINYLIYYIYYPLVFNLFLYLLYIINFYSLKKYVENKNNILFGINSFLYSFVIIIYILFTYYINKFTNNFQLEFEKMETFKCFIFIFVIFFILNIFSNIFSNINFKLKNIFNFKNNIFKELLHNIKFKKIVICLFLCVVLFFIGNFLFEFRFNIKLKQVRQKDLYENYKSNIKNINEANEFDIVKLGKGYGNYKKYNEDTYYLVINKNNNILTLYSLYVNGKIPMETAENLSYETFYKYLNNEFYNNSYKKHEKQMIVENNGIKVRLPKIDEIRKIIEKNFDEKIYDFNTTKPYLISDDFIIEPSRLKPNTFRIYNASNKIINDINKNNTRDRFYRVVIEVDIEKK